MLATSKEFDEFISSHVSLQRLITPHEIAAFTLTAAQSPIVNGAVLHAHGGQRSS
jgi:hypothetical protein